MLQGRLTAIVGAALLLTACAGVDGTERGAIRENVVEPGITAIGEARAESCGINASTMRTAIDAYSLLIGDPPPDEQALVDEGFLRSPMDDWDVVDGVIVAQNPACGDVPTTVPAEEIVTTADGSTPATVDEVLASFTDDDIATLGGADCARQLAVVFAGGARFAAREGSDPDDLAELEAAGDLTEPVTLWLVVDDELRPAPGSHCNDVLADESATDDDCAEQRRTMETAVEAFFAANGEYPRAEKDLVTAGLLREVPPGYDLAADGAVVPSPGGGCS